MADTTQHPTRSRPDDDDRPDGMPGDLDPPPDDLDEGEDGPEWSTSRAPEQPAMRDLPEGTEVFEAAFSLKEKPYHFAIRCVNTDTEEEETHEFDAIAKPGAGGQLALGSLIRYDPTGKQMVDLNAMMVFFERVLVRHEDETDDDNLPIPSDYSRLRDLCDRRDIEVPMETLGAVFNWLVGKYGGRPTRRSSSSSTPRRRRGR